MAKSLDEVFENKLSKTLNDILIDRKGTVIIEPEIHGQKIDKDFLVKLSTGLAYLVKPNFDLMTGKYYARFHVKHQDSSDLFTKSLHKFRSSGTDGTYVKEKLNG